MLGNDTFPTPTFLNSDEAIPEEGERSYGMQIGPKINRYRAVSNAMFATFFVNGELNDNPMIYEE